MKIIAKPKENHEIHSKSLQNLRKTNIFLENPCKTLGKIRFSMEMIAKPEETNIFIEKQRGQWHWTISICIGDWAIGIGPLPSGHCHWFTSKHY